MPLGKYPTFAACVADYVKSGKTQQQARRICGAIQKKIEGTTSKSANLQLPASLKAPLERSQKALKFLEQNNALVDTSLQSTASNPLLENNLSSSSSIEEQQEEGQESYTDKITRIMDEYGVDEPTAVETVNRLIKEEQAELAQQQLEIQKEIELQKAREQSLSSLSSEEQQQQQEPDEGQEPLVDKEEEEGEEQSSPEANQQEEYNDYSQQNPQ